MPALLVTAISDLHTKFPELPGGDLLIDSGDFSFRGRRHEVDNYMEYLTKQLDSYKNILFCAGNHEMSFEQTPDDVKRWMEPYLNDRLRYVFHETVDIDGYKIFMSPYQPAFCNWAFNVERGSLKPYWDAIPEDTDILVTHGPPYKYGDAVPRARYVRNKLGEYVTKKDFEYVGCEELLEAVIRVKPQFHTFGHIHEGYGVYEGKGKTKGITFVNASINDGQYNAVNHPTEFFLTKPKGKKSDVP